MPLFPDIPVHHFKIQYKKCTNPCCGKQGADRSNPGIRERTFCSEILWKSRSFYGVNEKACRDSRDINLKIEWGYIPYNALHLLALKTASVCIVIAAFYLGFSGQLDFTYMMFVILLSFHVFGSLEPIADCAHVLAVIDDALEHLDELTKESFIDADGQQIEITHYDIEFQNVDFSYGEGKERRQVLHNVNLKIPEYSVTAIVGPSGSGKSTICNLIARFYDADSGSVRVGGHDVKEFTCDSLLSNISMVFQNVYLFHDTVRNNICFGKPDATEAEMVEAAKKACCHDFIMALPEGYDTVIGEGVEPVRWRKTAHFHRKSDSKRCTDYYT